MRLLSLFLFAALSSSVFATGIANRNSIRNHAGGLAVREGDDQGYRRDGDLWDINLTRRGPKGKHPGANPVKKAPPPSRAPKAPSKKANPNQPKGPKGLKGAPKTSGVKGSKCGRKVHRRSIYDSLFLRADEPLLECDITLTLTSESTGQPVTDTIAAGSKNLGAASSGNTGVYRIKKWDKEVGDFIAKRVGSHKEMAREAGILRTLCQLIAMSPENAEQFWIIMKVVPGRPLIGSDEHTAAMALPKAQSDAFILGKRAQLVKEVMEKYTLLSKRTHGDLKNENVHWYTPDCGGQQSQPQLLDWGRVFGDQAIFMFLKSRQKQPEPVDNPLGRANNLKKYAEFCAEAMYPTKNA